MVLLLQLNGELPDFPGHERRLYVFSCRRKTCRRKEGSVRVLRGIRISDVTPKSKKNTPAEEKSKIDTQPSKPAINIGETLFGAKPSSNSSRANPFSSSASSTVSTSNPFASSSSPSPNNPFAQPVFATYSTSSAPPSQ